jgi:hypothetical protein
MLLRSCQWGSRIQITACSDRLARLQIRHSSDRRLAGWRRWIGVCITLHGGGNGCRGDFGCSRWLGIIRFVHCLMLLGHEMRSI